MRGSGYAIGEILIFLAIAAIIGFLIGWVVFYRRPGKEGTQLSAANPNHVRQLEGRTKAVESKLARLEKRATAMLETLQKTGPPTGAAPTISAAAASEEQLAGADETKIAPAAAAPEGAGKHGPRETGTKTDEAAPISAPGAEEAGEGAAPTPAEAPEPEVEPEAETKPEVGKDVAPAEYLTEADDRLAKLEDTLDKLSERLADLDKG
jgi:hypothetical protein